VRRTAASRATGIAVVAALLAVAVWVGLRLHQQQLQRERGQAIFRGEVVVAGTLEGHDMPLPALATRCANCHEARNTPPGARSGPYAAPLNRDWLSTPRSRRGGPASLYQSRDLCAVLRTGIDPAHIIVPTIMPRYEISEMQCADLWAFLQSR
jgi:hypothetical protein